MVVFRGGTCNVLVSRKGLLWRIHDNRYSLVLFEADFGISSFSSSLFCDCRCCVFGLFLVLVEKAHSAEVRLDDLMKHFRRGRWLAAPCWTLVGSAEKAKLWREIPDLILDDA